LDAALQRTTCIRQRRSLSTSNHLRDHFELGQNAADTDHFLHFLFCGGNHWTLLHVNLRMTDSSTGEIHVYDSLNAKGNSITSSVLSEVCYLNSTFLLF
jgi:hypothetical protein